MTPFNVACMCMFKADYLTLDNLSGLILGKD